MDIGQPKDFIAETNLYLNHLRQNEPSELATGDAFVGPVLVVSHQSLVGIPYLTKIGTPYLARRRDQEPCSFLK